MPSPVSSILTPSAFLLFFMGLCFIRMGRLLQKVHITVSIGLEPVLRDCDLSSYLAEASCPMNYRLSVHTSRRAGHKSRQNELKIQAPENSLEPVLSVNMKQCYLLPCIFFIFVWH